MSSFIKSNPLILMRIYFAQTFYFLIIHPQEEIWLLFYNGRYGERKRNFSRDANQIEQRKKEIHLNRKLSGSENILYPVAAREKGDPSLLSHPSSFLLATNNTETGEVQGVKKW